MHIMSVSVLTRIELLSSHSFREHSKVQGVGGAAEYYAICQYVAYACSFE